MNTATQARRSNALTALLARAANLRATATSLIMNAQNQNGKGTKGGRPVKRDPREIMGHVYTVASAERLFAADPLAGYVAFAQMAEESTPRTEELREAIAATEEARTQGILPCGDPAQSELEIRTHIRVTEDDVNGESFRKEARRALAMARAACQEEAKQRRQEAEENGTEYVAPVLYLRYVRNVITRAERNAKGKGNRGAIRAMYGGRLYISDRSAHEGTLLAIVTPNDGDRTALASYSWQVPGF